MFTQFRYLLFTVLALALTLTATAQRDSAPSALTLAEFTPSGVALYASTRTDAGFIETLDGLIGRLSDEIFALPSSNFLTGLLNTEEIRPWLGDSAALFILPPASYDTSTEDLIGILVEVKDRDAAIAYITENLDRTPLELPNGFTAFYNSSLNLVVTENLLVVGDGSINVVPLLHGATLAESPRFQKAIAAMPNGGDYPIFTYLDPRSLITAAAPEIFAEIQPVDVPALAESLGVMAMGMRQLDGQTYTFDLGWAKGEGSPFDALYLPDPQLPTPPALNPDFLSVVPADAQVVLHGAGLWSQFEASNRAAGVMSNALRNRLIRSGMWDVSLSNPFTYMNTQWLTAFTELSARGSLNLTPEQLRAALDSDSAIALRLSILPDERVSKLLVEPGVWFASRESGAADLLSGSIGLLESFGLTLNQQAEGFGFNMLDDVTAVNGANLVVVPQEFVWLATDTLTYIGADSLTLENKQTLVAVPRITDRLEPILPHLLEGATGFAWIDVIGLSPLLDETGSSISYYTPFDGLFASLRQTDEGVVARFAFRLK